LRRSCTEFSSISTFFFSFSPFPFVFIQFTQMHTCLLLRSAFCISFTVWISKWVSVSISFGIMLHSGYCYCIVLWTAICGTVRRPSSVGSIDCTFYFRRCTGLVFGIWPVVLLCCIRWVWYSGSEIWTELSFCFWWTADFNDRIRAYVVQPLPSLTFRAYH
jgi:hypothetical protein